MGEKVLVLPFVRGPPAKVLLLRRPPDHPRGGWHPVTGHAEPTDASPAAAAAREALEETGLAGRLLALPAVARFERDGVAYTERAFALELETAELPTLSAEHVQAAWVTLEEARRRLTYRGQVAAVEALEAELGGGA